MRSQGVEQVRTYTNKLITKIRENPIPDRLHDKKVVPAQRKKINEIKEAQIEALVEIIKFIDNHVFESG